MTQPTQQDVQQLTGAIGALAALLESWPPSAPTSAAVPPPVASSTGGAQITVNMGGWPVAVAALCAAFCLLLVIDQRSDVRDANRKIERAQDYNNMLWQRYPELRPERLKEPKK
jgi:hypothetical protein